MSRPPKKCPVCKSRNWIRVDTKRIGKNSKKGVLGAVLGSVAGGPAGLVAGAVIGTNAGKKQKLYVCADCGFKNWY